MTFDKIPSWPTWQTWSRTSRLQTSTKPSTILLMTTSASSAMKKKTLEFLEAHQSETPSTWREEAEWRRDNWSWLRHSQKIAVKVLLQMKQEGLTQKALAERMDCTQQYVSKILKGRENMSLDTLSKLEDALGINLIYDEQVAYPNMAAEEVYA